ncbi:hypothetical protein CROQUDRAFT_96685 [Cronartium quercuum f. sp. fusiforme G11]|uniref:Uncharacterized protein n=1 Tax=Cronartium quercuum f. sp. fusiforme G11 TaxID=708437 RepID=A0A9P6T903_9BASI|nr:hypothetical protein CROQUDRAFT_96685 [Cronartium quercuum f. sp. fusiforme G11]
MSETHLWPLAPAGNPAYHPPPSMPQPPCSPQPHLVSGPSKAATEHKPHPELTEFICFAVTQQWIKAWCGAPKWSKNMIYI